MDFNVEVKLHKYGKASSREIAKIVGGIYKKEAVDENMDVYIVNEKELSVLHFPLNPLDEINMKYKKNYQTHEIVGQGEFDFHKYGKKIEEISFKILIPDDYTEGFNRHSNIQPAWQYIDKLKRYMNQKEGLRLIITKLPFDGIVYISDFDNKIKAGMEGCRFVDIKFRTHRDIKIKSIDTSKQNKINKGLNKTDRANNKTKTYTYKTTRNDCLWNIAKRKLGKGARWREIYNLNKNIIGKNPNKLKPGLVIRIPKR